MSHAMHIHIKEEYDHKHIQHVGIPESTFSIVSSHYTSASDHEAHHMKNSSHLPLIPSAVISFRCCDILSYTTPPGDYGFVNWIIFTILIPNNVRVIYLLSEPLDYSEGPCRKTKAACIRIGEELVQFIPIKFPDATVALRRGFVKESLVMLVHSHTEICSPTTFCFVHSPASQSPHCK